MTRKFMTASMRSAVATMAVATALTAFAGTASAQEAQDAVESAPGDIVVTATRRNERLQDVAASVSAIGGDALAKQQITNIATALAKTPNLQVDLPYGSGGPPNFTIRGVTASDAGLNLSKPIALYIDDGVRNSPVMEVQPIFDIDRLEVLRGPQGTLYGRNATGGAVKIVSKAPDFDESGYVTAGYGTFNTVHLEGARNVQLVDDVLALRVSAYYQKNDGWQKSLLPGVGNGDQTDQFSIRTALRFKPSDSFDATLRFQHNFSGGRESVMGSDPSYLLGLAEAGYYPMSIATLNAEALAGAGYFDLTSENPGFRRLNTNGFNLQMKWNPADSITVESVTTYDWGRYRTKGESDSTVADMVSSDIAVSGLKQFYQELRVSSQNSGPFNWMAGANYTWDTMRFVDDYTANQDPRCTECQDPEDPLFLYFMPFGGGWNFKQDREGVSGFLRGEFEVIDSLKVHGGVRYSRDTIDGSQYSAYSEFYGDVYPLFSDASAHRTFENTSFELGADYTVAPDVKVYAGYNQGYRSGQLSGAATSSADQVAIIDPEKARSYEIGLKSQWFDRKLTFNVSLSTTQYINQQVTTTIFADANGDPYPIPIGVVVNVPKARINALEIEASVRPIRGVNLFANLGLADPKYKKGPANDADAYGNAVDIAGNQMVGAAKVNMNIGGNVDVGEIAGGMLTVGADATYLSKRYFDRYETEETAQKGYWVANATAGFELDHVSFNLNVKNVFNKHYSVYGYSYYNNMYMRGMPRTVMFDATYRF